MSAMYKRLWKKLLPLLAAALCLLVFLTGVNHLDRNRLEEGRIHLEDVLRRTAAACYAAEGIYPPDLDYMRRHYGISYDSEAYTVIYEVFASNLMPDITVLHNGY